MTAAPQPSPPPPGDAGAPGEHLLWHSASTRVLRRRGAAGETVIVKQASGTEALARLRHERLLLQHLAGVPGIARLADAPPEAGTLALQDDGGLPLAQVLETRRLPLAEALRLALALTHTLAQVHRLGVVHKDINPANILLVGEPAQPVLIDFNIATRFTEERPAFTHQDEIAGTLAYIAPEQTGRTGRAVDQRADLYALGATLYELLTHRRPFLQDDPLALIHEHLVHQPPRPGAVDARVPAVLSNIVMRLLEKDADRRYQSAEGLASDLARVARQLEAGDTTRVFPLGERDFAPRLRPPSRLVGRDAEIETLQAAFERALHGRDRAVLISGTSGVGKSALVNELRPLVTARRGWFVAGKFDQYRRDAGSGAVLQALRALSRLLLSEPEADVALLRQRLVQGLEANAGLAVTVLPELGQLLDVPAEPMPEDPLQAEARLLQMGLSTLRAVASTSRPIVMVIDDLQWAAHGSLAFVDAVLADDTLQGVLLVAIYRDADVDAAHPLAPMLERWRRMAAPPAAMHLRNLPPADVAQLLAEMLRLPPERAAELAAAVLPRTVGNPYETVELLNALRRDGALTLGEAGWQWEPGQIRRYVGHGDVAALLAARIRALPEATRALVLLMACLGSEVSLAALGVASALDPPTLEETLRPAQEDALLVLDLAAPSGPALHFVHDRVHQAAIGELDDTARQALHLQLARRLAPFDEFTGMAAEQFLPAVAAITEPAERHHAAALLRRAAGNAPLISYVTAERFLGAAVALLTPVATAQDEPLLMGLLTERHAALYCLSRHDEVDALYREIRQRGTQVLSIARATGFQLTSLTSRGRQAEAVALGLEVLRRLAEHSADLWPEALDADDTVPAALDALVAWVDTLDLDHDLQRPEVTDPHVQAAAWLMNRLGPPAYFCGPRVLLNFLLHAQRLWHRHGPSAGLMTTLAMSPVVMIGLRADYRTGYRLARHAMAVSEARNYQPETAQMRTSLAFFSTHWYEPLEEAARHMALAREVLLPWGSLLTSALTYSGSVPALLDSAPELDTTQAELDTGLALSQRAGATHATAFMQVYRQLLRALREPAPTPGSFDSAEFDEASFLAGIGSHPMVGSVFHICRAMSAAIFGDADRLALHAAAAMPLAAAQANYRAPQAYLLQGLALAQQVHQATPAARAPLLDELDRCIAWLAARAAESPRGFGHLVRWLQAERAWAAGDVWNAVRAFDIALGEANRRDRPWHRALLTERAALFHQATGLQQSSRQLLAEASRLYEAWGAGAKVAALAARHPQLPQPGARRRSGGTDTLAPRAGTSGRSGSVSAEALDMLAILRASQALSSETSLERLESRVVALLETMTGATRVTLVLRDDDSQAWQVPLGEHGQRRLLPVEEAAERRLLPLSALRYALRTRKPLLVEDATRDDRFARDPCLAGEPHCSLLVVPILSQGEARATVILENRLSPGAFAGERLDAVTLIAGQLAVSIDNARLYASLERKVAERTHALEEANRRLEALSLSDALTGLANRRRFDTVLEAEWQRAQRSGRPLALVMIDIDQFKLYNDHYGHPGGDDCLRRVGATLGAGVRPPSDLVARYGGEEFAIVLPETDGPGARVVAERLRSRVEAMRLPHQPATHGVVTISVGVVSMQPASGLACTVCVERADAALYEAKRGGRNRVVVAEGG
ncbi:MAG: diguanylate cyclase [Burkholderiales bacterium]|nr:diguanylate cyclase [Burkholderiales bacterium]